MIIRYHMATIRDYRIVYGVSPTRVPKYIINRLLENNDTLSETEAKEIISNKKLIAIVPENIFAEINRVTQNFNIHVLKEPYNLNTLKEINDEDLADKQKILSKFLGANQDESKRIIPLNDKKFDIGKKVDWLVVDESDVTRKEILFLKSLNTEIGKFEKPINILVRSSVEKEKFKIFYNVTQIKKHDLVQGGADFLIIDNKGKEIGSFSYKHQEGKSIAERYKGFIKKLAFYIKTEQYKKLSDVFQDFVNKVKSYQDSIYPDKIPQIYKDFLTKEIEEEFISFLYHDYGEKNYDFVMFSNEAPMLKKNNLTDEYWELFPGGDGKIFISELPSEELGNYKPYLMARFGSGGTGGLRYFIAPKIRAMATNSKNIDDIDQKLNNADILKEIYSSLLEESKIR